MDDFVIDQVSWHTSRTKRKEFHDRAYLHMKTIAQFLQANSLLRHPLLDEGDEIDESFCFRKSDLTVEGFEFIRKYYDKWADSHDRGKEVTDTSDLERWLRQMREKANSSSSGKQGRLPRTAPSN